MNIKIAKPLDLSSLQADYGTYAVGVRHIKIGYKKLDATVYYPVDKKDVSGQEFTATFFKD